VTRLQLKIVFVLFLVVLILYSQVFNESYLKQAVLFILEVFAIPFIFILTKNYKFDRFLGNLSFPIYLSQTLILKITIAKSFPKIISLGFTTLVLTIGLSILLDMLIAKPIEKYRQRRVNETNYAKAAAIVAAPNA
jgi:peptidoglycan/LPS O-acetylase OafA/YrhL